MAQDKPVYSLDISFSVLLKIILALAVVYFAYSILDILVILLVAIILATAIAPSVDWLQRYHLPRSVSLVIIYLLLFLAITVVIAVMAPPLANQAAGLANSLPYYYDKLLYGVAGAGGPFQDKAAAALQQALQSLGSGLAAATGSVLASLAKIFGGILQFILTLVITFYLIADENGLKRFALSLTPNNQQNYIENLFVRVQTKMGSWLRGQLLLMLVIGFMVYIGLFALSMPYALVLALWAGLTEVVPYAGPVLGAIPAILLALSISPLTALLVLVLYVLIQQLENNIIVPMIMKKSVGLNPIVSIIAVMVGYNIDGIVGALIAIPVATILALILSDIVDKRRRLTENQEVG